VSGHTLGPWNLGSRAGPNRHVTGERDAGNGKAFTSAPGNIIAYVPISRPEEEANAALIAAAPEMAALLSEALKHVEHRAQPHLHLGGARSLPNQEALNLLPRIVAVLGRLP